MAYNLEHPKIAKDITEVLYEKGIGLKLSGHEGRYNACFSQEI